MTLAGCRQNGPEKPDVGDEITFTGAMDETTKALITNDNLSAHIIVVNDVYTADGTSFSRYMTDALYSYSNGIWTPEPPYFWTNGGIHYFAAHHTENDTSPDPDKWLEFTEGKDADGNSTPASDLLSTPGTEGIELSISNNSDIIYAFATRDMAAAAEPKAAVSLNFRHALAAIEIKITTLFTDGITFKSAAIQDIVTTNTFSVTREQYENRVNGTYGTGTKSTIETTTEQNIAYGDTYSIYGGVLTVWPQSLTGDAPVKLSLTYNDGTNDINKEVSLSTQNINRWNPGEKYVYTISITDNYIYVTAQIREWTYKDVILQ